MREASKRRPGTCRWNTEMNAKTSPEKVFFPEIEEVGFSLDSIPGLRPVLCHFAVTPSRFRPRPRGSLDLVEEKRSVVSDP